ncbi:hypothetical protein Q4508_16030 [Amphritea sp. 2_MG-2023]|jgi:hypothetical protein|uniref:hypothetical protein n=1 Tax=Amphritea TaxID=515417 RepID=UPI001C067330|nr:MULTISPECIES: hypothetical protein [Amphritea]MBU2966847.1 hypothetical protein [Amphritea atlantica]MDO6420063.1 hypothetical protein [Amphritea sp. 2_MG-2023]
MNGLRIDAWLERKEPVIKLHSGVSNHLIAEWRGSAVTELFELGIVTCRELFSNTRSVQQQAAHELLLNACANSLCQQNGPQCFNCITGRLLRALAKSDQRAYQPSIAGLEQYKSAV